MDVKKVLEELMWIAGHIVAPVWGVLIAFGLAAGIGAKLIFEASLTPDVWFWSVNVPLVVLADLTSKPTEMIKFFGVVLVGIAIVVLRVEYEAHPKWGKWARLEPWAVALLSGSAFVALLWAWSPLARVAVAIGLMSAPLTHLVWLKVDSRGGGLRTVMFWMAVFLLAAASVVLLPYRFGQGFFDFHVVTTKRAVDAAEFRSAGSGAHFSLTCSEGEKWFHFGELQYPAELLSAPGGQFAGATGTLRALVRKYECEGNRLEVRVLPATGGVR